MRICSSKKSRAGLSILEVILATGISVMIIFVLAQFSVILSAVDKYINYDLVAKQEVEYAVKDLVTEMRSSGQSAVGGYPIESASTSSLVFFTDYNRDGVMERVRYTISGKNLIRGQVIPSSNPLSYVTSTEVVVNAVTNLIAASSSFQYYDSSYVGASTSTPMTSPINVQSIRVIEPRLVVDVATSSAPKPIQYSTLITIRNLKTN